MITVNEAARRLELSKVAIYHGKKYQPFIKRVPGKNTTLFDYKGYTQWQEHCIELTEKTRLLTEYLYHIEKMTYAEIARLADTNIQNIFCCNFGYKVAVKIARAIRQHRPFHWQRFHEYYGWEA